MNKPKNTDTHNAGKRTPEFYQTADALGVFIRSLALENHANDQLVSMIVAHVCQAEKCAFSYGFCTGVAFERRKQAQATEET